MINNPNLQSNPGRLASLDILRGLDMFLLVFFQPVLVAVGQAADVDWLNDVLYQFDHQLWDGFRFWDIIMPLFMFLCGVAMPFSFDRYINNGSKLALFIRILKRVLVLWILGMVVQGNLLALDYHSLRLYSNTLQAIAAGYLIGAIIILNFSFRWQIALTILLLIIYWLPMTFLGDFTPEGNFAEMVDRSILGHWRDDVYWDSEGNWHFYQPYTYTWIWSSLTFAVTVLLGYFAGSFIKLHPRSSKSALILAAYGIGLIALALLWHIQMPIIKRIWTGSMTLFAGGICFVLMAIFFWWIDVKNHSQGLNWLKIYGMNSITAYVIGEVIDFRSVAASISFGLEPIIGFEWYQAWLTFANFSIVFLILYILYKQHIFIKF